MFFNRAGSLFILCLASVSSCFSAEIDLFSGKDTLSRKSFYLCSDSVFSLRSKKGFIPSLLHNFGEQAVAPFKMTGKQALMVAGGAVITGALFFVDDDIDKVFKPMKASNEWVYRSSPHVSEFGNNYSIAFITAFGGYGLLANDHKAFRTSLLAAQAAITSGVWVRFGKMLTGRERPWVTYDEKHGDFWWGPFMEFDSRISAHRGQAAFDAFPSGHTSTAFSIASVFAHQYAHKTVVPVVAYSVATLVGISRLTEHEHWASDVFAGACIGYLCGKQVVKHERDLQSSASHSSNRKMKQQYFFSLSGGQPVMNCILTF